MSKSSRMNVKERIGSIIILTALTLSVITQPVYAAVNTEAIIVDYSSAALADLSSIMPTTISINGTFGTSQWYNGGIITTPGYFTDSIGSISRNTAELYLVSNNTWLTQSYTNSIMNTLTALYQNCSVPMATQLSYYLPIYKTDLEAMGTGIDNIATSNSLIKTNTDTIISYLQQLIPSNYMDVTIDNDDKNTVGNTIDTVLSIVPRDSDSNIYSIDLQSLMDIYINTANYQNIMTKNNAYKDWY